MRTIAANISYFWAMKILVVRFSSIGDIVLTSPVVRCLRQQLGDVEIHYLTKKAFETIVSNNPYVDQVFTIEKSIQEVLEKLKAEKYDFLVDLHHNVRTLSLKRKLGIPNATFSKLHVAKWLLVNFKWNRMPDRHIVNRYFDAVKPLKVRNDGLPCDFFVDPQEEIDTQQTFGLAAGSFAAFAIGAQFATKRMPVSKMVEVLQKIDRPVVLLGGKGDEAVAAELLRTLPGQRITDTCGQFSLRGSASIVKQAAVLLTHDTGLMHIASAFQVPIVSVWGNTVPAFGMYPYFPAHTQDFSVHEVLGLPCRPCSKIGFQACPKKHFNCMHLQDAAAIAADVNQRGK
jgi:ADP-heptose:LPS heptosyltransferase